MGKLVFYLLLAALIYWLVRARHSSQKKDKSFAEVSEDMVRCAHCNIYLPKSESISQRGEYFCCKEHCHLYVNSSS